MLTRMDRNSAEFKSAAIAGVMGGAGVNAVSHISYDLCKEIIKASGETGIEPGDLVEKMNCVEHFYVLCEGVLNVRNGCLTREQALEEVKKIIASDIRRTLTQYLARRVSA